MSKIVQVWVAGNCRGHQFSGVHEIDFDVLKTTLDETRDMSKEEIEEYLDEWLKDNDSVESMGIIEATIFNNYDCDRPYQLDGVIDALNRDQSYFIECEEETYGFGRSLTKAKAAHLKLEKENDKEIWD